MRISDWSSDVCSSDLSGAFLRCKAQNHRFLFHLHQGCPLELSHPESTALLHMLEIDIRYVAVSTEWIYTASISTFSSPLTPSWPNAASPAPGHGSAESHLPSAPPSLALERTCPTNYSCACARGYKLRRVPPHLPK